MDAEMISAKEKGEVLSSSFSSQSTWSKPVDHLHVAGLPAGAVNLNVESRKLTAQTQALVHANDPIYELSFRLRFGHKSEDLFWVKTLKALAAYLGAGSEIEQTTIRVDPKMQWSEAKNVWHNATVRTSLYLVMTPFRWAGSLINGRA